MSTFLTFVALLLAGFAVALASLYRRWVPADDVVDQRRAESGAVVIVLLAIALAFIGGSLW